MQMNNISQLVSTAVIVQFHTEKMWKILNSIIKVYHKQLNFLQKM